MKKKSKPAPKKKNTREKILECAMKELALKGVGETTVSTIARAAGIPHTLVLYHFPTMEALYLDVVLLVLEDLKTATVQALEISSPHPKKVLEAYIRAPFEWARQNPEKFSIWMYFYSLAAHSKRFRELNDSIRKGGRDRIAAILYEAIAKKQLSSTFAKKMDSTAFVIQGIITGLVIQAGTESVSGQTDHADEACDAIFEILHFVKNN